LRHPEGSSYNRSEKYLHLSVCFSWMAGERATFRQFEWRDDSNRALPDEAVSGGT
jgi:hypothetical protein